MLFGIFSLILSYCESFFLVKFLKKSNIYDIPNHRSNHKNPTPKGGGIAIIDSFIIAVILSYFFGHQQILIFLPIILASVVLAVISFIDDIKGVNFLIRLIFHLIAASIGVKFFLSDLSFVYQFLIVIFWVGFINMYNFMDGIDGLTIIETISILIGILILSAIEELDNIYLLVIILLGSSLGFLKFNWHPAKIFLGDVGSVFLGYIIGFLCIYLTHKGYYAVLILPLYYFLDSLITITKRAVNLEKIWQAHSKHYYQKAVRAGMSHDRVSGKILLLNIVLISLFLYGAYVNLTEAAIMAFIVTIILIIHFRNYENK